MILLNDDDDDETFFVSVCAVVGSLLSFYSVYPMIMKNMVRNKKKLQQQQGERVREKIVFPLNSYAVLF